MKFPYIPISTVIADVRAELKQMNQSGDIYEEDCLNYAMECIREIGGGNYMSDSAVVHIKNHMGDLPESLYKITNIWICEAESSPVGRIGSIWFTEEGFNYRGTQIIFPGDGMTASKYCINGDRYPTPDKYHPTYIVRHPNLLRTSIECGIIGIHYLKFAEDKGKLLMQDEIHTIKATKAYIKLMLLGEKFIMAELSQYIYQNLQNDYNVNLDQAQAIMKFSDPADDNARAYEQDHRYDDFKLK